MARVRTAVTGLTLAAAVGAAALAGAAAAGTAPAQRNLTASGTTLAYSKKTLSAPKGAVRLVLTNKSARFKHSVALKGNGIRVRKGRAVGRNGVSTVTATLAPGRYTYFCTVGDHEQLGMKGTLTVRR
jgi:plastocyanin